MTEEWRPVPDHPNYEVSNLGRVLSYKAWRNDAGPRILAGWTDEKGYQRVEIDNERAKVHALVLLAFCGPRPAGLEIRHLDGNPQNNRADNLAYGTTSENQYDRVIHGTHTMVNRTHCPSGHPYDDENTHVDAAGHRTCRKCGRAKSQRCRVRKQNA